MSPCPVRLRTVRGFPLRVVFLPLPFLFGGTGGRFFLFEHQFATGRVALRRLDVEDENFVIASGEGGELHLLCTAGARREERHLPRGVKTRQDVMPSALLTLTKPASVVWNSERGVGGGDAADFRNDGGVALREVFTDFVDDGAALPSQLMRMQEGSLRRRGRFSGSHPSACRG